MINLVVLLYRDSYFYSKYGPSVRDLQFLFELEKLSKIKKITVFNRPVSIHEKILFRKTISKKINTEKISTVDSFSYDLLGPVKGRAWADDVYIKIINKKLDNLYDDECLNVLLDFLPIGMFNFPENQNWVYWYDLIDNFTKHNRFSEKEKKLVRNKYEFVGNNALVVTGVSGNALSEISVSHERKFTIPNRIFCYENLGDNFSRSHTQSPEFDFGFIGFITDKFDIDFIEILSRKYTITIHGACFDKELEKKLLRIKNVKYNGAFRYDELETIIANFKVGLLPYIQEKSHDESPLKIYEYLKNNRPCLTSIDYELSNQYIINYKKRDFFKIIPDMLNMYKEENIKSVIDKDMYLSNVLEKFVNNNILQVRAI